MPGALDGLELGHLHELVLVCGDLDALANPTEQLRAGENALIALQLVEERRANTELPPLPSSSTGLSPPDDNNNRARFGSLNLM